MIGFSWEFDGLMKRVMNAARLSHAECRRERPDKSRKLRDLLSVVAQRVRKYFAVCRRMTRISDTL
jgi:hypothetical protein